MEEIKPAIVADCRGMNCPLPVIVLKRNIEKMKVGEVLKLVATDPDTEWDIPAATKNMGAQLLKHERKGNNLVYYLKRTR